MFPSGVYTVLVTPMTINEHNDDRQIDWDSFDKLIKYQIDNSIKNFIFLGTTSETPALKQDEVLDVYRKINDLKLKYPEIFVVVGVDGDVTEISSKMKILEYCCDAYMLTVPKYVKPPQEGIFNFFQKCSSLTKKPIMLYNIPSRTGANLEINTLKKLVDSCDNILAIKDATGSLDYCKQVMNLGLRSNFKLFSGDDGLATEMKKYGAKGVISVASNIIPKTVKNSFEKGVVSEKLAVFYKNLFITSNPIPIKFLLAEYKIIESDSVRMPLVELNKIDNDKIPKILRDSYITLEDF